MKTVQPYLIYPGTCEKALNFYAECFGGEIQMLQRYEESPLAQQGMPIPETHAKRVFNSIFVAGDLRFMASDDMPTHPTSAGTNFSMFVTFDDADEQQKVFAALSDGGKVVFPLDGGFGMVEDPFKVRWMLALQG